jgi:class 3 adenylate cyclase/tetratricopeptide (TPR) repeat protein
MNAEETSPGLMRHIPRVALKWMQTTPHLDWQMQEGTLLFADISGFTALAERLSHRGRQGGEELVSTLGKVFGSMLDDAAGYGGDLLKFGGDALLLFFDGDNHAIKAASAAVSMRRTLAQAAGIQTSVGPLHLSMSMGVHSGEVHFFLVGQAHRELILLGQAINRVIQLEAQAIAGEILVSTETAEQLPTGAAKSISDTVQKLRWRAPRTDPGIHKVEAFDATITKALFPADLGQYLERVPEPEHRIACIAFIGFSGTDAILENEGAHVLAGALNQTVTAVQKCFNEHGVTLLAVDVDRDGGKFFAAAGVPRGNEDDEGLMMRALRAIADQTLPLEIKIGVNRGHVFAAEVGSAKRAAYSAMGDTTNTAARVMNKAPVGGIYVHPSVLDECLIRYESSVVGPFTFKGKSEPAELYSVGKELGTRQREGLEIEEFVGRDSVLSQLLERVSNLAVGNGGSVVLKGAAGLGKTRLISEVLERSETSPCLKLNTDTYGTTQPFQALQDPLRNLLGIDPASTISLPDQLRGVVRRIAPDLEQWLTLIGEVLQIEIEPGSEVLALDASFRSERQADSVISLISSCLTGPQVFVIDGAQWLDHASSDLFNRMADVCKQQGWLILVARREDEGGFVPEQALTVDVEPLLDAEILTLVSLATEAAPFRTSDVNKLAERASGNPLFALELVRNAREQGSFADIPLTLEAALSAHIDTLDPLAKKILRYAAVLGRRFNASSLADLVSQEEGRFDPSVLDRMEAFLVAEDESWLQFRNAVIRDITYEGISFRRRRELHGAVGQHILTSQGEISEVTGELALHFSLAGDKRKAWQYGCTAARQAAQTGANADAAKLYEMALDASNGLDLPAGDLSLIWRELSLVRETAGLLDEAASALKKALATCGDDSIARAEIVCMRGILKDRNRNFTAALRDMSVGRKLVEGLTSDRAMKCRARLCAWSANINFGQDRLERARTLAIEAEQEARKADDDESLARALNIRASAELMLEGPTDQSLLLDTLALFERLGKTRNQANTRSNLGIFCAMAGDWRAARKWMTQARDDFLASGDDTSAVFPSLDLAEMLLKQRYFDRAETALTDALRLARANFLAEAVDEAELLMIQLYIAQTRFDDAKRLLPRVERSFVESGQRHKVLETRLARAAVLKADGELLVALDLVETAVVDAGEDAESLYPSIVLCRSDLYAELGRLDDAKQQLAQGVDQTVSAGMPYEEMLLRRARIRLINQSEPGDEARVREVCDDLGIQMDA